MRAYIKPNAKELTQEYFGWGEAMNAILGRSIEGELQEDCFRTFIDDRHYYLRLDAVIFGWERFYTSLDSQEQAEQVPSEV